MEDQRIRLSKSLLKQALLRLLEKKPLEEITVSELCQTAQINRTTFYKYYGNPQELLGEISEEFFDSLERNLQSAQVPDVDSLEGALTYLESRRDVFCILVNSIPDELFMERLFRVPASIPYQVGEICPGMDEEYVKLFLFHGGYAVIRRWLNSDHPEPAAEIARLIEALWRRLN